MMGILNVALSHSKQLAYDLDKFPNHNLEYVTLESVREAIANFNVVDKDEYAALIYQKLSTLLPDLKLYTLDDEGYLVKQYGHYTMIGSRLTRYDDYIKSLGSMSFAEFDKLNLP